MIILIPILFLLALIMLFIGKPLAMKIGLISSLLATLFLAWFACFLYKNGFGHDNAVSHFNTTLQEDDFSSIYETLDKRLKGIYSPTAFSDLFATIKEQATCIHTEHTSVSSSDNFHIILSDCNRQNQLAIVSFGGGDLTRWKITNIDLMAEK